MSNQAWWLIPLIPPHERPRQEDRGINHEEYKVILGYGWRKTTKEGVRG